MGEAMTYLAFILAASNIVTVLGFLAYTRTLVRPYQRREDVWADKVMHLAGREWNLPPAATYEPEPEGEPYETTPAGPLEGSY